VKIEAKLSSDYADEGYVPKEDINEYDQENEMDNQNFTTFLDLSVQFELKNKNVLVKCEGSVLDEGAQNEMNSDKNDYSNNSEFEQDLSNDENELMDKESFVPVSVMVREAGDSFDSENPNSTCIFFDDLADRQK
ncbi:MAG: hypothetical protein MHPSP_003339, partial [Paramarteilia canceri]